MKRVSHLLTLIAALHASINMPLTHAEALVSAPIIKQTGKTITITGHTKECFGITIAPRDENEDLDTLMVTGYWFDKTEQDSALRYKERGSAPLRKLQPLKEKSPVVIPCFFGNTNAYRLAAFRVTKSATEKEAELVQLDASEVLIVKQASENDCTDFGKSYAPLYLKPTWSESEKSLSKKLLIAAIVVAIGVAAGVIYYKYVYKPVKKKIEGPSLSEEELKRSEEARFLNNITIEPESQRDFSYGRKNQGYYNAQVFALDRAQKTAQANNLSGAARENYIKEQVDNAANKWLTTKSQ